MNLDQAKALIVALGGKVASTSGTWVRAPCVLAPYTHKSGKDSNPSFGIACEQGKPGRFHCFTCESGSLSKLLQIVEMGIVQQPGKFKGDLTKAREIVEQEEVDLPTLPAYSEFDQGEHKQFEAFPEYWLETYPPIDHYVRARQYWEYRQFTPEEAVKFDVRYDKDGDRLVFPYRDVFGRLAGGRGRGIEFPGESHWSAHHDYTWNKVNNASKCWYNEPVLDSPGPVLVVEGQFDLIRTVRVFERTIANLTAKPVLDKVIKLTQIEGAVLMLDGDQPGRDATKKFCELHAVMKIPTACIYLPYDPEKNVKSDPDKLGEEWIKEALTNMGLID